MKTDYSQALPESWMDKANMFRALADEHRQRLVMTFDPGERLTVGQLAKASTLSQSTVSHHLKELWKAGVLLREKQGKEVYYRLDKEGVIAKLQAVIDYANAEM